MAADLTIDPPKQMGADLAIDPLSPDFVDISRSSPPKERLPEPCRLVSAAWRASAALRPMAALTALVRRSRLESLGWQPRTIRDSGACHSRQKMTPAGVAECRFAARARLAPRSPTSRHSPGGRAPARRLSPIPDQRDFQV